MDPGCERQSGHRGRSIAVFLVKPPEGKAEEILKNIAAGLDKELSDVKIEGTASEHEINGIHSWSLTGSGKTKDGKDMDFSLELLAVKKPLIILEVFEKGAYDKHQAVFDAFENSFTALEGAAPAEGETPAAEETPAEGETPDAAETPE